MKRLLLAAFVGLAVLAACGGQSRSTPNPTTTAVFEEQRAILAATREAEWTATSSSRPTQTPPPVRMTATPQPTETPRPTTPPTPLDLAGDVTDLIALMPALVQFPDTFLLAAEGSRTTGDLAADTADPATEAARLEGLGFQRAAERVFEWYDFLQDGSEPRLRDLTATIIEFDTPEHALAVLTANHERAAQTVPGYAPIEINPIGDVSRAASGQQQLETGQTEYRSFIWIQAGNLLIEYQASSRQASDTFPDVERIARTAFDERPSAFSAPLPRTADLPSGFQIGYEGPMEIADLASFYEGEAGQVARLNALGFRQSALKFFTMGDFQDAASRPGARRLAAAQGGIALVYAIRTEFGSPEQAREAIEFDREYWTTDSELVDVEAEPLGDISYVLRGEAEDSGIAFAFAGITLVQDGPIQYTLVGLAFLANDLPDAVHLTKLMLARADLVAAP